MLNETLAMLARLAALDAVVAAVVVAELAVGETAIVLASPTAAVGVATREAVTVVAVTLAKLLVLDVPHHGAMESDAAPALRGSFEGWTSISKQLMHC